MYIYRERDNLLDYVGLNIAVDVIVGSKAERMRYRKQTLLECIIIPKRNIQLYTQKTAISVWNGNKLKKIQLVPQSLVER